MIAAGAMAFGLDFRGYQLAAAAADRGLGLGKWENRRVHK